MAAAEPDHDDPALGWSDVVDNLPVGVFRSAPDGRILRANRALADLLGYELDDLIGLNARDIYVDPMLRDRNVAATEDGADRFDIDSQVYRSDGTVIEVRGRARVRRRSDGSIEFYEGIIEDLRERRRLDRALRFGEAILGAAFDHSATGMLLLDPERRVLRINEAMCTMLGRDVEELLGERIDRFAHPVDAERGLRRFEEVVRGVRESYRVERKIRHTGGHDVCVLLTVTGIRNEEGEVEAILEQAIDISERRAAEDALLRSQAANDALIEAIPDPIFRFDRAGTFVDFHPGRNLPLVLAPDEFLGRTLAEFYSPELTAYFVDAINRVIDWNETETVEYPDLAGTGRVFAARFSRYSDDEVIGVVHEVTDIHRKIDAAERWKRHAEAMFVAAPHHLVAVSADGTVMELRSGSNLAPRLPAEQWVGRSAAELLPGMADEVVGIIADVLATGKVRRVEFTFPTDVERTYEAIFSRSSEAEVVAAVRELPEHRSMERSFRAELSARDEFVASVSHELRDPLATVVGIATELRDRLDDFSRDELAELVGMIAEQGSEMTGVVEDLLVATRADVAKLDVAPVAIELADEVAAVARTLRERDLELSVAGARTRAFADPRRFRQIMRNLIANARRHGGSTVRVHALEPLAGFCRIVVADDGPPIPESVRDAMFAPYERGGATAAGSGLGLTVARKLARLMGGDLTYDHAAGWSTFTLTLPEAAE